VLSVLLRFTDFDYPFGIFKIFSKQNLEFCPITYLSPKHSIFSRSISNRSLFGI